MKEKLTLTQIVIRYTLCTMNLLFFSTIGVPTAQASALLESGEDYPATTVGVPIAQASAILTYVGEHLATKGAELILGSLGFGDSEKEAVEEGADTIQTGITDLETQFQQLETKVTNDFQNLGELDAKEFERQDVKDLYNIVNTVQSNKNSLDSKIANSGGLIKKFESYVEDANKGSGPFINANSNQLDRYNALKKYDPDFVSIMQEVITDEITGQPYYDGEIGENLSDLTPYSLNQGQPNSAATITVAVQSMQEVLVRYMNAIQQGESNSSSNLISLIAKYDTLLIHQAGSVVQAVEDIYESEVFLLQLAYMGFQVPGISISNKPLMYQTPKEYQMSFAQLQLNEGLLKKVLEVFYQGYFYTDYAQNQHGDNLLYLQVRDLNVLPGGTLPTVGGISSKALNTLNALAQASKDSQGDLALLDPSNVESVLKCVKNKASQILANNQGTTSSSKQCATSSSNQDTTSSSNQDTASSSNQDTTPSSNQDTTSSSNQDTTSSSNQNTTPSTQIGYAGPFAWNKRCMIFQYYSPDLSNQQSTKPLLGSYDGTELTAFCKTADKTQTELRESTLSLTTCQDPSTDVPIVPNNTVSSLFVHPNQSRYTDFPLGTMFCQIYGLNTPSSPDSTDAEVIAAVQSENGFKIVNHSGDEYNIYLEETDIQYVQLLNNQGNLYQVSPTQWHNASNKPGLLAIVQFLTKDGYLGIFGITNYTYNEPNMHYLSLFCSRSFAGTLCSTGPDGEMGQFSEITLFGNCTVRLDGGGGPIGNQKGYLHICEGGQTTAKESP